MPPHTAPDPTVRETAHAEPLQPPGRPLAVDPHEAAAAAHRMRLGRLAEALALHLGWDADDARLLRQAAPLHDVGAMAMGADTPAADAGHHHLLAQPRRAAALLGGSSLPLFALAAEIALHHRERWDGSGYPKGLRGQEIPLPGRIVAVVDCFDTLTMPGDFRPARADDRALAMLAEQAGSAFDPDIVATFLAHADELIALRNSLQARHRSAGA